MTRSFVIDPETGKLLTAQEWKLQAGEKVADAKMVAIVPDDGSPAFAFPTESLGRADWKAAMEKAKAYQAPHPIEGSDGTFTLPTRKQGIDFREARSSGLEQLLQMIGANQVLEEIRNNWHWTREPYVAPGTSEEDWSCVRYSSGSAWYYVDLGMSAYAGFADTPFTVRPVTLLRLNP